MIASLRHHLASLASLALACTTLLAPAALSGSAAAEPTPASTLLAATSAHNATALRTLTAGLTPVPDATPDALHISLDGIAPHLIDADSDNQVKITGTLTNVGKLPITDIELRLQRGDNAPYGNALRHTLTEDQINYPTALPFHSIDRTLDPGQSTTFTLTARIHGGQGDTLHINAPGVYPILINANGRVANSTSARLHDARTLLPVLQIPGRHNQDPAEAAPRPVTLLWPLAATPQEASYYSFSSVAVLRDERLGQSLAPQGRLRNLLDTATALLHDRTLGQSVCLAVDPELLRTVNRMTRPYRVLNNPAKHQDGVRRGKHTTNATTWLDDLRSLASNSCVIALPWGGADLASTAHTLPRNPQQLMADSRNVTSFLLRTRLSSHVIWPNIGMLTSADTAALDHPELLLSSTALEAANPNTQRAREGRAELERNPRATGKNLSNSGFGIWYRYNRTNYTVTPFDSTLATALAATGHYPTNTLFSPSDSRYLLPADSTTARMQDAVATLLWKTSATLRRENLRSNVYAHAPLVIAPPQYWTATAQDLTAFTDTLRYLARHKLITAQPLTDALANSHTMPRRGTLNTDQLTSMSLPELPTATVNSALGHITRYTNLFASSGDNNFYKRTRYNIYRATTTRTWGATPVLLGATPEAHNTLFEGSKYSIPGAHLALPTALRYPGAYAHSMVLAARSMRSSVTLIKPASIYTLASRDSDLVLVARNELPADVTVTVRALQYDGHELAAPQTVTIPAQASLNLNIPVHLPSGKSVPVSVRLLSPDKQELGNPVNMTVRVSRITPVAGFVLVAAVAVLALLIVKRVLPLIRRGNGQGKAHV